MNEKLQYASMLEMPVNTVSVTYKPAKKKRRKLFAGKVDSEQVKRQLMDKVNAEQSSSSEGQEIACLENLPTSQTLAQEVEERQYAEQAGINECELVETEQACEVEDFETFEPTAVVKSKPKAVKLPRLKISVIGVQFIIIGVLMATIFLTSALNANSGVNVFLRGVFGVEQGVSVDNRTYLDFEPVLNADGREWIVDNGVMTFSGEGSVYAPCNGEVVACEEVENGKFSMTVKHSEKFSSVLTGLDYVYASIGDKVRGNIPVGYSFGEGATMCFTGLDGSIIAGYQIVDNSVVWAV